MSTALVRKSLDLIEAERVGDNGQKKTKKQIKNGIKKQRKSQNRYLKGKLSAKSVAEEIKKKLKNGDTSTEDNVLRLKLLGGTSTVDTNTANKLFRRAVKDRQSEPVPEEKLEGTLFTEEDFLAFEKEYVDND